MDYNKTMYKVAHTLVMLGAIQLGLAGLSNFDLIGTVLVNFPEIERLLLILIGVSGVYMLTTKRKK